MSLTFEDVKNRLKAIDEISLLEILEISSEDIVDRFEDKIVDKLDTRLMADLEEFGDSNQTSDAAL